MLRRVKIDVIAEMTKKKEEIVHCRLSSRQQVFYQAIKNKISLNELLDGRRGNLNDKKLLSLMNIVMQLRKVQFFLMVKFHLEPFYPRTENYVSVSFFPQLSSLSNALHETSRSAIIQSCLSAMREAITLTLRRFQILFFLPHLGNCKIYIMQARGIQ
jgi:hypothetical protein